MRLQHRNRRPLNQGVCASPCLENQLQKQLIAEQKEVKDVHSKLDTAELAAEKAKTKQQRATSQLSEVQADLQTQKQHTQMYLDSTILTIFWIKV